MSRPSAKKTATALLAKHDRQLLLPLERVHQTERIPESTHAECVKLLRMMLQCVINEPQENPAHDE